MKPATITLTAEGVLDDGAWTFSEPASIVIGRATDCDIQVAEDGHLFHMNVSRHHCLLDIDPPLAFVRDLGSRNGTFVNGAKIGQRPNPFALEDEQHLVGPPQELKHGDELQIGNIRFHIGIADAAHTGELQAVPLQFV
jgi:eukaryotic-like serine/threonine-protein kinase